MKEYWKYKDKSLVDRFGYLSHEGLEVYWASVDAAIAFNAKKRDWFLAKSVCDSLNSNKKKMDDEHPSKMIKQKIALCGLRWFKLNMSKYQKDVKLLKRCQVVKKMSNVKHLDYGGGSQKN